MKKITMLFAICMFFVFIGAEAIPAEKKTIVFRQHHPVGQIGKLRDALKEFERIHPNIKIEFETVPWGEGFKQFAREIQAGGAPDLIQTAYAWAKDQAKMGGLLNLEPYIQRDLKEVYNDWRDWNITEYKGNHYAVPWCCDSIGIVYRKDLFEEAGLELPDSWTELLATAMKLSKDRDGDGTIDQWGLGMSGGMMWFWVAPYMWTQGIEVVEKDPKTGIWRPGFDNEAGMNTLRYWRGFIRYGASPPGIVSITSWFSPELLNGIVFGDYAMIMCWPKNFVAMKREHQDVPLGVMKLTGGIKRFSVVGGNALAIPKTSKYPEEAWELLKFLEDTDIHVKYLSHEFSTRKSTLKALEPIIRQQGTLAFAEQTLTGRTFIHEASSPAALDELWDLFAREYANLLSNQKTVEQVQEALVNGVKAALKRGQQ